MTKRMHCEEQLRYDIGRHRPTDLALRWAMGSCYSTSALLEIMREMVFKMKASHVAEVGCGRSTIALADAANDIGATFNSCDRYDYRWLYPELFVGEPKRFWAQFPANHFQVIFLDHLSSRDYTVDGVDCEIKMAWSAMAKPGVLMIHDAGNKKYAVSRSGWIKKGAVLPFGHSLGILVKGKWSIETEPGPKKPDTTEAIEW